MYGGFEGVKTLVDVGGDNGSVLNMIISNYLTVRVSTMIWLSCRNLTILSRYLSSIIKVF
jgi:hypothetical protein